MAMEKSGDWGNGSGTNTAETDEKKTNWAR
jgi:hypothetical protein